MSNILPPHTNTEEARGEYPFPSPPFYFYLVCSLTQSLLHLLSLIIKHKLLNTTCTILIISLR